jgi:hypothetical protein
MSMPVCPNAALSQSPFAGSRPRVGAPQESCVPTLRRQPTQFLLDNFPHGRQGARRSRRFPSGCKLLTAPRHGFKPAHRRRLQ